MTAYYMLMASLPRHDRQYKVNDTPLSQLQLDKRIKLMPEEERTIARTIVNLVWLSAFSREMPFANTLKEARILLALPNPFIHELVEWHMDLRSLLTALRWRHREQTPPERTCDYWYTRFNAHLLKHWQEADFGLKHALPWFPELARQFDSGDTASMENTLLNILWKHLDLIEARHYFDLEAVIIYLLRWQVVNYWSKFNETAVLTRINVLAQQIVKESAVDKILYEVTI